MIIVENNLTKLKIFFHSFCFNDYHQKKMIMYIKQILLNANNTFTNANFKLMNEWQNKRKRKKNSDRFHMTNELFKHNWEWQEKKIFT